MGPLLVVSPASPSSCPFPTSSLRLFGSLEAAVGTDPAGGHVGPGSLPLAFAAVVAMKCAPLSGLREAGGSGRGCSFAAEAALPVGVC